VRRALLSASLPIAATLAMTVYPAHLASASPSLVPSSSSAPDTPVVPTSVGATTDTPAHPVDANGFITDGSPQLDDAHCVGTRLEIDQCLAARHGGFVTNGDPQLDDAHCVGTRSEVDQCLAARNDGFVTNGDPQLDDAHCVGTPNQVGACQAARRGLPWPPKPTPQAQFTSAAVSPTSGREACVISRESGGNPYVMNSSGHYGLYQFAYGTWVGNGGSPGSFGRAGPSEQRQVFLTAVARGGYSDWSPNDGC